MTALTHEQQAVLVRAVARRSRGAISFWRGRYDKAIEDIHIISQLMPENGKYRELLTEIRRRIGVAS